MKALIIEDEIIASDALQSLIQEVHPDIEIVAILQSIDECIEWFQLNAMPDLIFMDIHLADGSSFDIFETVSINCPVIFTTAYDEYALKAFEVNSIDYLLKPINKKDLERAIRKYENLTDKSDDNSMLINKLLASIKGNESSFKSYFLVPEKDKLIPLPVNDIACIYIDLKMTKIVTYGGKVYYLDKTLDELMQQLDPKLFFRANRQYIIARDAIVDISIWFASKLSVNLKVNVPDKILISKGRASEFKTWISK